MRDQSLTDLTCDVVVVGSGVAGLAAAVTAGHLGLNVVVIEKASVFGGTAAFSGGVLWVPNNHHAAAAGISDSLEEARAYLRDEAGEHYRPELVEAYLEQAPRMLKFFEENTHLKCQLYAYPDYHPDAPGGVQQGRSLVPYAFDIRALGKEMARLRRPLRTITFMGMMFSSSNNDLKHFFNATRSLKSLWHVTRRLSRHALELLRYRRGITAHGGNAAVARLARSAFDLGIPLHTGTRASRLLLQEGEVRGIEVLQGENRFRLMARRGVVLASGGFAQDTSRLQQIYPHVLRGGHQLSPTPTGGPTGDGIAMAEHIGAKFVRDYPNAAAWIPTSRVPLRRQTGVFPHLVDRYKPGLIMVNPRGERFCNEADSYHDVGIAMIARCQQGAETYAWQICDHRAIRRYGMGFAKPAPVPLSGYLRSGYLIRATTLTALAEKLGLPPGALEKSVARFNEDARQGTDSQFRRGESSYNRYLGDAEQKPNPCLSPLEEGPFYALRMEMGDLGTFCGLKTDGSARVLDSNDVPIPGLYAAGNEMASVMGGSYPGAGITLGPAATFGYIAAHHLAERTRHTSPHSPQEQTYDHTVQPAAARTADAG